MLDEDISYYKANKEEFKLLYAGKFLVIKDKILLGVYDTRTQANDETLKLHAAGTFIIERPMNLGKRQGGAG